MAATPVMALVIEYMRTIVSGLYAPQVSRKTTLPFRAMRPEAPFSRPVAICSCITVLIRFRRSREKPACSGAAVGKLAPATNDATKQKTKRIRMSANLSQKQAPGVRQVAEQWAAELGLAIKPSDPAFTPATCMACSPARIEWHRRAGRFDRHVVAGVLSSEPRAVMVMPLTGILAGAV
jgi:hypothetical protein